MSHFVDNFYKPFSWDILWEILIRTFYETFDETIRYDILMIHFDKIFWWDIFMQLFDQTFWWEIMMRHSDETLWWDFFMRPFDDTLWWDFLVFQFFSFCLFSNTHSCNRYTVRLGNMTINHKISPIFVLKVKISHKGEMGGRVGEGFCKVFHFSVK